MREEKASRVYWQNLALGGGVQNVAQKAITDGLLVQLMHEDKPAPNATIQRIECTLHEYEFGAILDAPDTAWRDTTLGPATYAELWLEDFGRAHPLFRNSFGGAMSVIKGDFTIVWHTDGIADFGDVWLYEKHLAMYGMIRPNAEVTKEAIECLQKIQASLERM